MEKIFDGSSEADKAALYILYCMGKKLQVYSQDSWVTSLIHDNEKPRKNWPYALLYRIKPDEENL